MTRTSRAALALAAAALTGCGRAPAPEPAPAQTAEPAGTVLTVRDTVIPATLVLHGTAAPIQSATLSTRLAAAVTQVLVREGQPVRAGAVLLRLDARDLAARHDQAAAGLTEAEAVAADAETQARRFRALFADSAATPLQLEAAETGLARARAGLERARAAAREVATLDDYAAVRAPFAGVITRRLVDPGDFAAPGTPLLTLVDGSRLRISGTLPAGLAARLAPGTRLEALIERLPAAARIEGVAPAAGSVYTVNATVDNPAGKYPVGGAAELWIATGTRSAILIPAAALVRQGDLVGVRLAAAAGPELRWLRLGEYRGGQVEVLAGLRAGDRILLPGASR